jgi:hypothetical protein
MNWYFLVEGKTEGMLPAMDFIPDASFIKNQ